LSALLGQAVLAVWNDINPATEADYNAWYQREHVPERLAVPGMRRARRYRAAEGSPRYAALYEAATLDVLTSGAYRAQLANPTEWTRRAMRGIRLMRRGLCTVISDAGHGIGGAATFLQLRPDDGVALRSWIHDAVQPTLLTRTDVVAVHAWSIAPGEPVSETTASLSAGVLTRPIHWVLMVETIDVAAANGVRTVVSGLEPQKHGAAEADFDPSYQLLFVATVLS
jgi:hypothetical protein